MEFTKKVIPQDPNSDSGIDVAIATDYNPGSSNIQSMVFIIALATIYMNMDIYEAIGDTATNRPVIIFMHPGAFFKHSLILLALTAELNSIFTDSECPTKTGTLTHVALKAMFESKIFFVSTVIFHSSCV